jgi:hypothetical protein
MKDVRSATGLIYRLFLLSWILAVLWVKGYLWWIFAVSVIALIASLLVDISRAAANAPAPQRARTLPKRRFSSGGNAEEPVDGSWREPMPPRSVPRSKNP